MLLAPCGDTLHPSGVAPHRISYAMPVSRPIKVALAVTAAVVIFALATATIFTYWSIKRPYPDYDGSAEILRLTGDVEIIRDEHGIPHIYAETAEDLFRAQGYVHAQDRFWEMDLRRHITAGRLSELFGADQVDTDAFVRTLGWRRVAQQELPLLAPDTRRYLSAYSDGVNAWLDGRSGGELGFAYTMLGLTGGNDTPDDWNSVDSLSWLKAMAWDLRANMESEIDRALLSAVLPDDRVEVVHPSGQIGGATPIVTDDSDLPETSDTVINDEGEQVPVSAAGDPLRAAAGAIDSVPDMLGSGSGIGSNAWVVDGSHTVSGEPLLANDPHLAPSLPSVWYQVGLHCREQSPDCPFDVVGFSFSGVPGVIIGHNGDIAWGFTNLGADVTDLYLEEVRRGSYRVGNEWRPLDSHTEDIEVAGGEDVSITVRSTRNGPLISDHDDQLSEVGMAVDRVADEAYGVSLRWTALEPGRTADAIFALNQATDWEQFRAAAAIFEVPSQNLVYADTEGNIGYQAPGKIPVRTGGDGTYPVPGWNDDYQWAGYIPFDELPWTLNPDEGFIVTANQPVTSAAYGRTLTEDFQHGYRSDQIRSRLEHAIGQGPVDVTDMLDIQMDDYNAAAEILVPYLEELRVPSGYYGDGLRLLADWDYTQPPESAAAAYFNAVWSNLLRLTFHDELPEETWPDGGGRWFTVMADLLQRPGDPFWDDVTTGDEVETRNIILRRATRDARNELTRLQGKDPGNWEWGRLHALEMREMTFGDSGIGLVEWLFNRDSVEVGGGPAVVQANGWDASEGYKTSWVPSMRMVVDTADFDGSRWIDLTGISGHPRHEHYGDQTELWRTGSTLPMRWSRDAVRDAAEHTFLLVSGES